VDTPSAIYNMPRQKTGFNAKSLRNLPQYKDLDDEEFNELMLIKEIDASPTEEFETRIKKKIEEFEVDYDFSDMKINDMLLVRALAQAIISLEDLEQIYYKSRLVGITLDNITLLEKLSKQMADLRSDISKMQDDLKITRRIRKSDKEESVVNYLESLTQKAHEFYEQKMSYILCDKCNMLLGTIWTLYPQSENVIVLTCKRKLDSGEVCNNKVKVTTAELLRKKGSNKPDILPESLL